MLQRPPLSARTSLKVALITFLILSAISLAVIFSLPKTYVATTRIQLERKFPTIQSQLIRDPFFIQNEFERIKSDVVLLRAATQLRQHPDIDSTLVSRTDDQAEARLLRNGLEIRQTRNTSLIEIRYAGRDPAQAAQTANTIARSYAAHASTQAPPTEVKIIDLAQPPPRAASPNVPLLLLIATCLNATLAVMSGFFASNFFR